MSSEESNYDLGSLKQLLESDASAPDGKEPDPNVVTAAMGILVSPMGINLMVPDMDSMMKILEHDEDVYKATLGCLALFFPEKMKWPRDAAQHLALCLVYAMTHFDMSQGDDNG